MRTRITSPHLRARAGLLVAGLAALSAVSAPAALAASPSAAPSPAASAAASSPAPAAPAASAAPSRSGSPSAGAAAAVTTAGTSFLTATTLAPGQDAAVAASTGDYLYWAFAASEGQSDTVRLEVALAPSTDRHGPQSWAVEVFDGLRRRQACTAGPQSGTADQATGSLALSCTLRQVRSWAEPWSGDPLPGTYYVRLSAGDVPQNDVGLAVKVRLHVDATGGADDAQPEGGSLRAPLVPPVNPGATAAPGAAVAPSGSAAPSSPAATVPGGARAAAPVAPKSHWYSDLFSGWNDRWFWTLGGAALAALAGIGGYTLTRHPRGPRAGGPVPAPRQYEYQS